MSIKFAIRNTAEKAKKEGDSFVRFSGTGEPFNRNSERLSDVVKTDSQGNPLEFSFVTGLDDRKVQFYQWFTEDEKNVVKQTIKDLTPKIKSYFGDTSLNSDNQAFWKRRRDINLLKVTNENIDVFYDTDRPEDALLYLSIIGGAFLDLVAPNKEWAERFQLPHYMALEMDTNDWGDEEEIRRSDAHGELTNIRKEFGKDALYILAWCLQYETNAFGAYNYATPEKDLISYHIKYIDGKLVSKRKRNMPKTFIEYAEKWKASQTRQLLYVEAYVKAGEYYNFINQREKKYTTSDGTILGNTISDAVENLMKPKFKVDLENLRTLVENKWKE